MKIGELRGREPFHDVFVSTVAPALDEIEGGGETAFEVEWIDRPRRASETWLCNDRLNAIYRLDASGPVRRAVRSHYGRSSRRHIALASRAYIALATTPISERLWANGWVHIRPAPRGSQDWLFRGGGRRIRVMNYRDRLVWVLAKPDHDRSDLEAELALRGRLPDSFPAPRVLEAARGRYCEQLISGVPLDQVESSSARANVWDAVATASSQLFELERREVKTRAHCERIVRSVEARLSATPETTRSPLLKIVSDLSSAIEALAPARIEVGLSHGDLQGDNIIVRDPRRGLGVTLVDWEFAAERNEHYALIDRAIVGHRYVGVERRLADWCETGEASGEVGTRWSPASPLDDPAQRFAMAPIYLLEKLELNARTATSAHLSRVGDELEGYGRAVARFLESSIGAAA